MSFEDEKLLGNWGAIFYSYLLLLNYDLAPNFWWKEFLAIETALGILVILVFRKNKYPNIQFYAWCLVLWIPLFIAYSSFSLLILGHTFGNKCLWLLIPLWVILTAILIRSTVHLKDGTSPPNPGLISWFAAVGASFTGVLTFYFSKATLSFVLEITMNVLLSFGMACAVIVWIRRCLTLRSDKRKA
ncbi:hypothetical protein [Undibacterium sp. KW1]|uniref:hypothetical protein n=1 Tax=Undibacterium sp. KW1 TaxID=2058624 RepID=UPI001389CD44|nr:hypothetical protein [Undibacterium sp. KW1]